MNARRAVVTGASGNLGYHVTRELLNQGILADILIRTTNENTLDLEARGGRVHQVDLQNPKELKPLLARADVLFHLAAENTTDLSRDKNIMESTVGLTKTILLSALDASTPTIVYTSSAVVLGRSPDPRRLLSEGDLTSTLESPYVRGKVEADRFCESLIQQRRADVRRLYPSWVIGPNDPRGTPPHQVINQCLRKGQRFWFKGGISVASVKEVARAHVNAWLRGEAGGRYVLGGTNLTYKEFFALIAEASHQKPPRIYLPKAAIVSAATLLNFVLKPLGKKPPIEPAYARAVINTYSWYDSSRARRELGYVIPPAKVLLDDAVRLERRRVAGTYNLGKIRRTTPKIQLPFKPSQPPLLITGAPGWLGNRFLDLLVNGGNNSLPLPRSVHLLVEARHVDLLDLPPQFRVFPGKLDDPKALDAALAGVGTVIHLAGAIYPARTSVLHQVNFEGTKNLVDACIASGVRRFLYMSTDSVCGHGTLENRFFDEHTPARPYSHYGASKYRAEHYLFEKTSAGEIDGTVLRGFWFFGPFAPARQKKFLRMMTQRRQLVFGNGRNYRSISHVDNIISAFLQIENSPQTIGRWYWIGDARIDYTVDDIYRILCEGVGNGYRPVYIPGMVCRLMRGLDSIMAKMGRLHPTIHGIGKFDLDIAGSIAAARRDFGYEPVTSLTEYAQEIASDLQ